MSQCKHYDICGRDVEGDPADGWCILHSTDPAKDTHAFTEALAAHRKHKGDNFSLFVFPDIAYFNNAIFGGDVLFSGTTFTKDASFGGATFSKRVNFARATFSGETSFGGATFSERADFDQATFSGVAYFAEATFSGVAYFAEATFTKNASFAGATFTKDADFGGVTFSETTSFPGATFSGKAYFAAATFIKDTYFGTASFNGGADFGQATFSGGADFGQATFSGGADFDRAIFLGRALFAGRQGGTEVEYIFARTRVDFTQVVINSADAITFLKADLKRCRFLDTDLRKVQLVDVTWPQKGRRWVAYDEIISSQPADGSARLWPQLERLYRELKQNYEDRRDYERAGDFHYGEKEMRRQNPDTTWGLCFFLTLYWLFSGYGERYLRPLLWAGLLFVGSTIGYMWWGLHPQKGGSNLVWSNAWDWFQGAYYSFRVMTFLKPDDWVPVGYAHVINTFQTLLAPIFLGLFALALRQRLKR